MLSSLWLRDPAMQMASRRLCSSIRSSEAGLGKRCMFWGRLCVADRALDVGELSLREKVRTEVSLKLVFQTLQHLAPRQEITFQQEEQYKELRSSGASEPERQWQLRRGGARCRWEVRWDENQQDPADSDMEYREASKSETRRPWQELEMLEFQSWEVEKMQWQWAVVRIEWCKPVMHLKWTGND